MIISGGSGSVAFAQSVPGAPAHYSPSPTLSNSGFETPLAADATEPENEVFSPLPAEESSPVEVAPRAPEHFIAPPEEQLPAGTSTSPPASFYPPFSDGLSAYILGPGDQLGIAVAGFTELDRTRIILPDGTILLPLIGPVVASGKTLDDLEAEITRRYSFYLVDPVVELNLSVLRPVVVAVGGEVNRPGPVQLNSLSTFNTRVTNDAQLTSESTAPTISTALVGAGGIRRSADLRNVQVQRQLPNGELTRFRVNLWDSIFQGMGTDDILLQDGDVVFVPEAPPASEIDPQLVARSSLAPDVVRVRVIGEVRKPGEVQVPPDGSVSSAIAIAGGHNTETADLGNVALLRLLDNGQVEEQVLDLNNLVDATPIRDGDVVVVPKRRLLNTLDNVSRFLSPITAPFNFLLLLDNLFD